MLHLLASIVSLSLLAGAGTLVVHWLGQERAQIVAALLRVQAAPASRPWASRVRATAATRPAMLRVAIRRAAA